MAQLHSNYSFYKKAFAHHIALCIFDTDYLTADQLATLKAKGKDAKERWLEAIKCDAEKESKFCYVPEETYCNFVKLLDI